MHILPGDQRRSLQWLGLEHRPNEGWQKALSWFSLGRGGEGWILCPVTWCTRGKRTWFVKRLILVYLLRKVFHLEGGR